MSSPVAVEEFLRYVVSQIVEYPDEVIITKSEESDRVTYFLAMRKSDLGKIIGRGGHTIHALRSLLQASASRRGIKANLQILE